MRRDSKKKEDVNPTYSTVILKIEVYYLKYHVEKEKKEATVNPSLAGNTYSIPAEASSPPSARRRSSTSTFNVIPYDISGSSAVALPPRPTIVVVSQNPITHALLLVWDDLPILLIIGMLDSRLQFRE